MASITIKYDPNLVDEPTLSDIGWLWTLRIYASGKIPLNFESSWPVHLLPLIEKYATDNQGKESIEFKYEFLANELDRLGSAKTINDSHLAQNLRMVADSFTLSDIERQILEFRTIYRVHNGLEQTVDLISNRWTDNLVHQIIGHALAVPTTIIADALRPESKLIKSGLLIMHSSIKSDFGRKLIALDGFVNGVQSFREKTLDIFGFLFNKATGATLALNNFAHQKDDIDIIIKYLEQCHKHKRVGVNILLHGVPGVGKTELARLISQELEITAYEVSSSDFDSDDQNDQPPSRFKSYLILQNLISQMDSGLIIFDEIEDVLPRLGLLDRPSNGHKAWINNLLETNQSPSIWISNHVNQIDPAILRRFDFILEVKNPPSEQRVAIIKQSLGSLETSEQWIEVHQSDLKTTSTTTQNSLNIGYQVGDIARQIYDSDKNGILIDIETEGFKEALARSQSLQDASVPIFEAGFSSDGLLAFADVMLPCESDGKKAWKMIEVKSSTSVKEYHKDDIAVQCYVAGLSGFNLQSVSIARIDSSWVYPGEADYSGLLVEEDLTDSTLSRFEEVKTWVDQARQTLSGDEPVLETGKQCLSPYECGFYAYCTKDKPKAE